MTNALRELEGGMPIRAAAQFLSTIQGFNAALSVAFPIIGAIALFGVVEKIGDKLGIQVNIWKQIEDAQKSSNAQLKSASSEYDTLIRKLKSLQDEEFKRRNGGVAAAGRQAFESTQEAETKDRQTIQRLEEQVAAIQRVAQTKIIPGEMEQALIAAGIGSNLTAREASAAGLAGLTGIEAGGYPSQIQKESAQALLPGLEEALRTARLQREVHTGEASDFKAKQDQEIDTKNKEAERKAQEAQRKVEEAQRKAEALEAKQAAIETKASLAYTTAFFGDEAGPRRRLDTTNARIEAERGKALTEKGVDVDRINKAFDLEKVAAFIRFLSDGAKDLEKFNDEVAKAGIEGRKLLDHEETSIGKALKEYEKTGLGGIDLPRFGQPDRPEGYVPPEQRLRDARDRGSRAISQVGLRNQLSGAGEGQTIADDYRLRISLAQEENRIQLEIANKKHTEQDRQDARDAAEDELHQKRYDADMQRETALLELALRQKEAFQSAAVGLFNAAKSGNIPGFLRGQLNNLEDKVVGNAAGLAAKSVGGLIPRVNDPNSTLGKLLQGTPFGADPLKTATVDNTTATIANTAALQNATRGASGAGGASGPGGISIPGIGRIPGFSIPGGSGGSTSGTASDTGYSVDGVPRYSPENYDPNGVFLGTGATSGHDPSISPIGRTAGKGITTAQGIGIGVAAAGAGFGAYEGFKAGGAQGALQGVGSILGAASLIPGPQQIFVIGAAIATGIAASLFGDPKARRENEIQNELKYNQYLAPVAIHASMTTGGTYSDFDRFGAPRGSGLSPFPTVEQGFFDYRHGTTVPGRTDSQFGGPGGLAVTVQVQTLDSRSFNENSHLVADAVQHALQTGRATGLQETLRHL